MSGTTDNPNLQQDLNDLREYFIIFGSIIGAFTILSLCLIVILYCWNYSLSKKIKKIEPLANFKISRPKLNESVTKSRYSYDNRGFNRNPLASTDNNRIVMAEQNKGIFDNTNFSFVPNNNNNNLQRSESYEPSKYSNRDSKYY